MEYQACGAPSDTCMELLTGSLPAINSTCQDGCFCKLGFVEEGEDCILPEKCGCVYEGNYLKVATSMIR